MFSRIYVYYIDRGTHETDGGIILQIRIYIIDIFLIFVRSFMRVAICDVNTFPGVWQKFLALSWRIGCFLHKLFGQLDDYHVATSWDDAFTWLETRPKPLTSIQLWGHGAPGTMWVAGEQLTHTHFGRIVDSVTPETVVWFRTCSTFRGTRGQDFAVYLATLLKCTIAAHTRTIGVFQSGLHTIEPGQTLDGMWLRPMKVIRP